MRRAEPWLIAISLAGGLAVGAPTVSAQPDPRDHRAPRPPPTEPSVHDRRRPPPPGEGPTEAPPAVRGEVNAPRAGFVWIPGRWDWRGSKWAWLDGRWERERAGKRWNPGHWDKHGDHWMYSEGGWVDAGGPPPPPTTTPPPPPHGRPDQPPPPPREERQAPRAGFVWITGKWDWRAGKWDWVAGHWERERTGKRWNTGRWDKQGDRWVYVDGDWVDANAPTPIDDRPPGSRPEDHRRVWRLERPTVSSYWPVKGKVGSRITIRGRNFPRDASVLWGGTQVTGAKVTPDEIVLSVPAGATSGTIALRTGGRRELVVGNYEVAADYDAAAEAARVAEAARLRAERAWAERQRELAKDRAARMAAVERHRRELAETREQRRAERLREIRARWQAAFLADPNTQDELTLHAQRSADLDRMREIAELSENGKLVIRIGVAQSREDERHQARMTALQDSFGRTP